MPSFCWKSRTAAVVRGPITPSLGPGSKPLARRASWAALTWPPLTASLAPFAAPLVLSHACPLFSLVLSQASPVFSLVLSQASPVFSLVLSQPSAVFSFVLSQASPVFCLVLSQASPVLSLAFSPADFILSLVVSSCLVPVDWSFTSSAGRATPVHARPSAPLKAITVTVFMAYPSRRPRLQAMRQQVELRGAQRAEGNRGGRFSRMAWRPSRTSSPMNVSISSAIDWSKIGPAMRSQLFSERLVQRMACWLR